VITISGIKVVSFVYNSLLQVHFLRQFLPVRFFPSTDNNNPLLRFKINLNIPDVKVNL
jgi:hypothetical protein